MTSALNRLPRRSAAVAALGGASSSPLRSWRAAPRQPRHPSPPRPVTTWSSPSAVSAGSSRPTLRARSSSRPEAARQPRRRHPPPRRAAPPRIPTRSCARAAGCPGTWSSRARTCGSAARCARRRAVVGSSARPGAERPPDGSPRAAAEAHERSSSGHQGDAGRAAARRHLRAVAALAATCRPRPLSSPQRSSTCVAPRRTSRPFNTARRRSALPRSASPSGTSSWRSRGWTRSSAEPSLVATAEADCAGPRRHLRR